MNAKFAEIEDKKPKTKDRSPSIDTVPGQEQNVRVMPCASQRIRTIRRSTAGVAAQRPGSGTTRYHKRIVKKVRLTPIFPLLTFICVVLISNGCYSQKAQSDSIGNSLVEVNENVLTPSTSGSVNPIRDGSDLLLVTKKLTDHRYRVSVTNVSEIPVYCGYLPGKHGISADYFPYITEKQDDDGQSFRVVNTGGHFAPGWQAIKPKSTVTFDFREKEVGIYRLRINYLTDASIVLRTQSIPESPLSKAEGLQFDEALRQVITSDITISHPN